MSKTYKIKESDTAREIRLRITSGPSPNTAVLILKSSQSGVRFERPLENETNGDWVYSLNDADFTELFAGQAKSVTYKAEMFGIFEGGVRGTFPTEGTLIVQLFKRL